MFCYVYLQTADDAAWYIKRPTYWCF